MVVAMSGGSHPCALSCYQSGGIKIIIYLKWDWNSHLLRLQSNAVSLRHVGIVTYNFIIILEPIANRGQHHHITTQQAIYSNFYVNH